MIEEFKKYVNTYNLNDKKIKLKYDHSIRVMKLSEYYAILLNYSKVDIELASLIGLLHDYGRFEQARVYNSFDDHKTIDHADFSVEQLFEKGEITNFWDKKEDYELICFAIKNHNKFKIENITDERILKFTQLIRDVDKIDILKVFITEKFLKFQPSEEPISKKVKEDFMKCRSIKNEDVKNKNDLILLTLAFTFDIYNKECFDELKKYYKLLQEKCCNEIVKPYYDFIYQYIEGEKYAR